MDLACGLSAQINFAPALNFNTTTAVIDALFTSCVSPNGSQPQLKSSLVHATGSASGCSPLLLTIAGTGAFVWQDGSTTPLTFTVSTNPLMSGTLGFNAVLTSGPMAGDSALAVPLIVAQDGLCGLGGVRSLSLLASVAAFYH